MVFLKVDIHSVEVVQKALENYSIFSGLRANSTNSEVFIMANSPNLKQEILNMLWLKEGNFPIKYLGLPFISENLTKKDYGPLINKITALVNSWFSKFLSYAKKLQLIKSVLFSLQAYWTKMLILPKKVIKIVEQKLSRFLWNGLDHSASRAKISWDHVCKPRNEGLGLRTLEEWNKVAIIGVIWNIFAEEHSIWVAWVHLNLLKRRSHWVVKVPQDSTWSWRKILNLREITRPFIKFIVGFGETISLWHEYWHPNGTLFLQYGYQAVYDAASSFEAKVSRGMVIGFGSLLDQRIYCAFKVSWAWWRLERENKPISTAGKTRRFSSIGAWKRVRTKFPEVWWWKLLWFSKTIPRHACIGWFTTKDWMICWGITIDTQCILCRLRTESKDGCSFLKMIWGTLMLWCLIKNPKNHWEDVLGWISVEG